MQARTMKVRQYLAIVIGITAPLVLSFYLGKEGGLEVKRFFWSLAFSPAPEMQGYPYALHRIKIHVDRPGEPTRTYSEQDIDQVFRTRPFARVSLHRTLRQPYHLARQGADFFCGHPELDHLFPAGSKVDIVYTHGNDQHTVEVRCP